MYTIPDVTVENTPFNVCKCENITHSVHTHTHIAFQRRDYMCDYMYWPMIFLLLASKTEKMEAVCFI